jgi:hypothetical protein
MYKFKERHPSTIAKYIVHKSNLIAGTDYERGCELYVNGLKISSERIDTMHFYIHLDCLYYRSFDDSECIYKYDFETKEIEKIDYWIFDIDINYGNTLIILNNGYQCIPSKETKNVENFMHVINAKRKDEQVGRIIGVYDDHVLNLDRRRNKLISWSLTSGEEHWSYYPSENINLILSLGVHNGVIGLIVEDENYKRGLETTNHNLIGIDYKTGKVVFDKPHKNVYFAQTAWLEETQSYICITKHIVQGERYVNSQNYFIEMDSHGKVKRAGYLLPQLDELGITVISWIKYKNYIAFTTLGYVGFLDYDTLSLVWHLEVDSKYTHLTGLTVTEKYLYVKSEILYILERV